MARSPNSMTIAPVKAKPPKTKPKTGFQDAAVAAVSPAPSFPPPGPPVSLGVLRLESDSGLKVESLMGPTAPVVSDGAGVWDEVARPHKKAITDWTGQKSYRMSLDLLLEGFIWGDISVEPQIQALEQMARRDGGDKRPPKIRCTLPGNFPRSPAVVWVVEGLDWGDALRNVAGQRTRQAVTVTLLEFVGDDLIRMNPAKKARQAKKGGGSSSYTVKKGDTLPRIAAKFSLPLSDLKKANPKIRDSIKAGDKLKIPDEGSKAVIG